MIDIEIKAGDKFIRRNEADDLNTRSQETRLVVRVYQPNPDEPACVDFRKGRRSKVFSVWLSTFTEWARSAELLASDREPKVGDLVTANNPATVARVVAIDGDLMTLEAVRGLHVSVGPWKINRRLNTNWKTLLKESRHAD